MKVKKFSLHKLAQDTIDRLVKPAISWPREIKLFRELYTIYPNPVLWTSVEIGLLPTLAFFKTENGKDYLTKTLNAINYEIIQKESIILSNEKCGEDKVIDKPLSIKDFLRG